MNFGESKEFAIEAYHEPSGPKWLGFGRMAIDIQGVRIGDSSRAHVSLSHAVDRFRELCLSVPVLWDSAFAGLSDSEVFSMLDRALYIGEESLWDRFGRFDFLTNVGEQFDGFKTFIVCSPQGEVRVLYRLPDDTQGSASCAAQSFRSIAESFIQWFDGQVNSGPKEYFPVSGGAS